jgi:diadenosine tetraphosphate (Ap4A) HIT family hydrolase
MPCVFCEIVAGRAPASVVIDEPDVIAFMDIYPWRPGHVLVVPRAHAVRVADLPERAAACLLGVGARIASALRGSSIGCDDVHFLINDGPAAAQTVPHVHLHVVPRVRGDTWRLSARLVQQPVRRLLGATSRAVLDGQAGAIRAGLPAPNAP